MGHSVTLQYMYTRYNDQVRVIGISIILAIFPFLALGIS